MKICALCPTFSFLSLSWSNTITHLLVCHTSRLADDLCNVPQLLEVAYMNRGHKNQFMIVDSTDRGNKPQKIQQKHNLFPRNLFRTCLGQISIYTHISHLHQVILTLVTLNIYSPFHMTNSIYSLFSI